MRRRSAVDRRRDARVAGPQSAALVFALDDLRPMGEDTPLRQLLNALRGHAIAKGEMMATYEAPTRR
jgi:hypothetical protein